MNPKFNHTIYSKLLNKKTKKFKTINILYFLSFALKKQIASLIAFKKFFTLLNHWFTNLISSYYQTLQKVKDINNSAIHFYIKKKLFFFLREVNKYKYYYIKELIFIFFLKNKNIKNVIEKQIDLNLLKNKNIVNIFNKIKNMLFINHIFFNRNESFFNDYLTINKYIKKEYILLFSNNRKELFSIIKNKNNDYLKTKNIRTVEQLEKILNNENEFKIQTEQKNNIAHYKKWLLFYLVLKNKEIIKTLFFNVLKNKKTLLSLFHANITTFNYLNKKNTIMLLKKNSLSYFFNNINNKNTFLLYYKQYILILNNLIYKYHWITFLINEKNIIFEQTALSNNRMQKKKINKNLNKLIIHINKKSGATYLSNLLNDQMYYWSSDYNLTNAHQNNHMITINEIQKKTYKNMILKYLFNVENNILFKFKNYNYVITNLREIINEQKKIKLNCGAQMITFDLN